MADTNGRVHLYAAMSLDGYLAATDGGIAWLDPYGDARDDFTPFVATVGSAIVGRKTYDEAVKAGYANFGMPTYVVTHRPFEPANESIIPYEGDLQDLVAAMRRQYEKDIWLIGGGALTKHFFDDDLIDLYTIGVIPTLLGAGLPMFPRTDAHERRLTLTRVDPYESGVVHLRYARKRG